MTIPPGENAETKLGRGHKVLRFVRLQNAFLFMERYAEITEKRKREIALLRGRGCAYEHVTGKCGDWEIINIGSVIESDGRMLELIKDICRTRKIGTFYFESHYMCGNKLDSMRGYFGGIDTEFKPGVETFDRDLRENVLKKGIAESDPSVIARGFDEADFLFGIMGQTVESMRRDIEPGLEHFERICVNLIYGNSTPVKPDGKVVEIFVRELNPIYAGCDRVDIPINNTDFEVGS